MAAQGPMNVLLEANCGARIGQYSGETGRPSQTKLLSSSMLPRSSTVCQQFRSKRNTIKEDTGYVSKGIKRIGIECLEAYSDRDSDALNAILATDVTLYEIRLQNEKTIALPLARGLKSVTEWLEDDWKGSLTMPVAT